MKKPDDVVNAVRFYCAIAFFVPSVIIITSYLTVYGYVKYSSTFIKNRR